MGNDASLHDMPTAASDLPCLLQRVVCEDEVCRLSGNVWEMHHYIHSEFAEVKTCENSSELKSPLIPKDSGADAGEQI